MTVSNTIFTLVFIILGIVVGYVWYTRLSDIELSDIHNDTSPVDLRHYTESTILRPSVYLPNMQELADRNESITRRSDLLEEEQRASAGEITQMYDNVVSHLNSELAKGKRVHDLLVESIKSNASSNTTPVYTYNRHFDPQMVVNEAQLGLPKCAETTDPWSVQGGTSFLNNDEENPVAWITSNMPDGSTDSQVVDHCKSVCLQHPFCKGFEHTSEAKSCTLMGNFGTNTIFQHDKSRVFQKMCEHEDVEVPKDESCKGTFTMHHHSFNIPDDQMASYMYANQQNGTLLQNVCGYACVNHPLCQGFTYVSPTDTQFNNMCMFAEDGKIQNRTIISPTESTYTSYDRCDLTNSLNSGANE